MLNREYIPRWKIELEQAKAENTKEVTKEVTMKEAVATIKFMKDEGLPEVSIRKFAKQKDVPVDTVDKIISS